MREWRAVPSAYLPLCLSALALVTVLLAVAAGARAHAPDEGAAAHLWQGCMALQCPLLLWFAVRHVWRGRASARWVAALQCVGVAAAVTPVWWLGL